MPVLNTKEPASKTLELASGLGASYRDVRSILDAHVHLLTYERR